MRHGTQEPSLIERTGFKAPAHANLDTGILDESHGNVGDLADRSGFLIPFEIGAEGTIRIGIETHGYLTFSYHYEPISITA
jgi:hypothetical protein